MFVRSHRQSELGAMLVQAHTCWDGKTKVINDSDCPPRPATPVQSTPVPPAPVSMIYPAPPTTPTYEAPAPTPRVTVVPPPALIESIPTIKTNVSADPEATLVALPAGGGGGQAQAGIVETEAPPVVEEKKSWIPLAVALLSLYSFA